MKVPTERLREMLAASELLNGEAWGFVEDDERVDILIVRAPNDAVVAKSDDYKRASFIADCDPATIRSALSELLELRETVRKAWLIVDEVLIGPDPDEALASLIDVLKAASAVAWRYRYEETGEDNEMIWSDWIVVKWKPNRSVFSTKVEIEPLAPLSGGGGKDNTTNSTGDTAEQRVTDEAIDRAIKAYCDEPSNDMRDMMRAALSTMGGKP